MPRKISKIVLILFCDACQKTSLQVPSHLQAEALVGKVNLKECLQSASLIQSSDPDFRILEDGSIYTTHDLILSSEKKSFSILLSDTQGQEQKEIEIARLKYPKNTDLKRSKRRWAPSPCSLMENSLGPFPQHVQQVQPDAAQNYTIFYSISGPGQYQEFLIYIYATTVDGYAPEYPLTLLFKVEDDNDNAAYFEDKVTVFSVPENCQTGNGNTAIDLDEPDTLHTRLKYKILQQIPDNLKHFSVHPDTVYLFPFFQKCDMYKLIMEVRDMGGQSFGLFNTGTITISLEDENDNSPCFTETSYFTEVEENRIDFEILRMAVYDQDLPNTPHSKAVYKILQGDKNCNFKISTDPNTNEAVLCVVKSLNYEVHRQMVLQTGVLNEAQFSKATNSQTPTMCITTVTVKVKDHDEGPECQPPVKVIKSKDGLPVGTTLLGYEAVDPDSGTAEGLRMTDFEIMSALCSRESAFVKDNQYNVSVIAMDAGESCPGTLVVLLEDDNDYPPQIEKEVTICRHDKDFAVLKPVDQDGPDNGPPFQFILDNSASKLWTIETLTDGKTAILHELQNLDYNYYSVPLQIKDRHGVSAKHMLSVRVCDCTIPSECRMTTKVPSDARRSNAILGRWAILAMVLGSALLSCILFTCICVTAKSTVKKCFPEDVAEQNLIVSNTEAPGEEVMEANIRLPTQKSNICDTSLSVGTLSGQGVKTHQSFDVVKGCYTLDPIKGGQGVTDTSRYTYTDWHSFTQPRLGKESIRGHTLIKS
uniref:Cadherin-2 n=1 Tax=Balaenoptera musculus TaxID=9771 RepID=A0A8C0I1R6_BALMU